MIATSFALICVVHRYLSSFLNNNPSSVILLNIVYITNALGMKWVINNVETHFCFQDQSKNEDRLSVRSHIQDHCVRSAASLKNEIEKIIVNRGYSVCIATPLKGQW